MVADTYEKGQSFDMCMLKSSLDNDTINIVAYLGMTAGFGYQIMLFNNECMVRHFVNSDSEIYRLNESDPLSSGLSIPCENYKLTLASAPTYKKESVVKGIIELTSITYYEFSEGKQTEYKTQLTGYFSTDPLRSTQEREQELLGKIQNNP